MSRSRRQQVGTGDDAGRLRIALVFDAIFPVTKGGAERWFTALAAELAANGHEVTYVTSRRAEHGPPYPFEVCEVSKGFELYDAWGKRRLMPSVLFSLGVARFLLRRRKSFDIVYVHQTPLFPVITARLALGKRTTWAVEWIEWWPREYWERYAPGLVGRAGWLVQRAALLATPRATVFANSTEARLRAVRPGLRIDLLPGQLIDDAQEAQEARAPGRDSAPLVVFVGRLVPEKHADAVIAAVALLSRSRPVRARLIGQGPLLDDLRRLTEDSDADIEVLGPVDQDVLEATYREAAVLLHPSEREGFGLVVAEAAARGVPVVVVEGPDNAAVELIVPGVNGFVSPGRDAVALAAAVELALDGGEGLRRSTAEWFSEVARRRSVKATAAALVHTLGGVRQHT